SPDSPAKLAKFVERDALTFPLVSDADHGVLEAYGAYGEKMNYGKKYMGVIRSTFVITPDGKIEYAFYNVKAKGHVAKLRRDLGIDGRAGVRPGRPEARRGRCVWMRWAWRIPPPVGADARLLRSRRLSMISARRAGVAELADAPVLGTGAFGRGGSSPPFRTKI